MLNKIVNKSKIALTASLCAVSLHTMAEELQFNVAFDGLPFGRGTGFP